MPGDGPSGGVFVTVGTTKFESLIRAVDTDEFASMLQGQGYRSMTVQIGEGEHKPSQRGNANFEVDFYALKPSLSDDIKNASLVISHGGAGTIMEVMRAEIPLVVVINESLMDNHQVELAEALESRGHLISTTPQRLLEAVQGLQIDKFKAYQQPDVSLFSRLVDREMGFG